VAFAQSRTREETEVCGGSRVYRRRPFLTFSGNAAAETEGDGEDEQKERRGVRRLQNLSDILYFPDQIKQVHLPNRFVRLESMPVCRPCSSSPTGSSLT
jgi:hypothetical protein